MIKMRHAPLTTLVDSEFSNDKFKSDYLTPNNDKQTLLKDLPRTQLIDFNSTVKNFQTHCKDVNQELYSQDMFGGFTKLLFEIKSQNFIEKLNQSKITLDTEQNSNNPAQKTLNTVKKDLNSLEAKIHKHLDHLDASTTYNKPNIKKKLKTTQTEQNTTLETLQTQFNFLNEQFSRLNMETRVQGQKNEIKVAYKRADGSYGSIGLFIQKQHQSEISDEWGLSIIKHPTGALKDRETTLFIRWDFLDITDSEDIEATQFQNELKAAIGSDPVYQLISNLFTKAGKVDLKKYTALQSRLICNHNIDARDERAEYLKIYLGIVNTIADTLNHDPLKNDIIQIQDKQKNEINFFELNQFKQTLQTMFSNVNQYIQNVTKDKQKKTELKLQHQLAFYALTLKLAANTTWLDTMISQAAESKSLDTIDFKTREDIKNVLLQQATDIEKRQHQLPSEDQNAQTLIMKTFQSAFQDKLQKKQITRSAKEYLPVLIVHLSSISFQTFRGNIWRRNRPTFLTGAIALFASLSLALIVTGVLAPLGIALAAGSLASAGAMGVAATTGAAAMVAGAKIAHDEKRFKNRIATFKNDLNRICESEPEQPSPVCNNDIYQMKNNNLKKISSSSSKKLQSSSSQSFFSSASNLNPSNAIVRHSAEDKKDPTLKRNHSEEIRHSKSASFI